MEDGGDGWMYFTRILLATKGLSKMEDFGHSNLVESLMIQGD